MLDSLRETTLFLPVRYVKPSGRTEARQMMQSSLASTYGLIPLAADSMLGLRPQWAGFVMPIHKHSLDYHQPLLKRW